MGSMAALNGDAAAALGVVAAALRDADGSGPPLVDRTALGGSAARGTRTEGEPADLVAFLNVDLQFGAFEGPQALERLESSLRNAVEQQHGGELRVRDRECRGGLWAEAVLPAAGGGSGGSDSGEQGQQGPDLTAPTAHAAAPHNTTVRVFVAENMRSARVGGRRAGLAGGSTSAAAAESTLMGPVDEVAARDQQRNLLAAALSAARHSATASWPAHLSCGFEEARRLFWERQAPGALRTAREMHRVWLRAAGAEGGGGGSGGDQQAQGVAADSSASKVAAALSSDAVLHLLDVLAVYAWREEEQGAASGGGGDGSSSSGSGGADGAAAVMVARALRRALALLAKDGSSSGSSGGSSAGPARIELSGGLLAAEPAAASATDADADPDAEAALEGGGAGGAALCVLDPCEPCVNLHAAAVGVVEAAAGSGGAQVLQAVAGRTLRAV